MDFASNTDRISNITLRTSETMIVVCLNLNLEILFSAMASQTLRQINTQRYDVQFPKPNDLRLIIDCTDLHTRIRQFQCPRADDNSRLVIDCTDLHSMNH